MCENFGVVKTGFLFLLCRKQWTFFFCPIYTVPHYQHFIFLHFSVRISEAEILFLHVDHLATLKQKFIKHQQKLLSYYLLGIF